MNNTLGNSPKRGVIWIILLILGIGISYFSSSLYSDLNNTLKNNPRWQTSKKNLELGVVGSISSLVVNTTLAKNRLNLATYYGFEEYRLNNTIIRDVLTFDFFMQDKEGSFSFIFGEKDDLKYGIRISNLPYIKSQFFKIDKTGKYTANHEFKLDPLKFKNTFRVLISKDFNQVDINKQQIPIPIAWHLPLFKTIVSFKAGMKRISIDNLVISENTSIEVNENFTHPLKNFYFVIIFLVTVLLVFILQNININKLISVYLIMFLVSLFSYTIHNLYFYEKYPEKTNLNFGNYLSTIKLPPERLSEIQKKFQEIPNPKVFFLGGSQAWGAGATKHQNVFSNIILKNLKKDYELKGVNLGISGWSTNEILNRLESDWIFRNPKILILSTMANDHDINRFKENLIKIIKLIKIHKVKLILIQEPAYPFLQTSEIYQKHKIMEDISSQYRIRLLKPQAFLENSLNSGEIWWDWIHLTDYGHKLLANYLYPQIKKEVTIKYGK